MIRSESLYFIIGFIQSESFLFIRQWLILVKRTYGKYKNKHPKKLKAKTVSEEYFD